MKKYLSVITAVVLCLSLIFNFTACSKKASDVPPASDIQSKDLMSEITASTVSYKKDIKEKSEVFTDFAVRLFKECAKEDNNMLISPLSVLCALSMTANGAEGDTLEEMERVLGMSVDELNAYVHTYMALLTTSEEYKLKLANSIWFTDDERFSVNKEFLQVNADYYGADIYQADFNDAARDDINAWVKDKTDEMIDSIIDKIPPDAVMYLVNALAFDAEWEEKYGEDMIRDGVFTAEDGVTENAKFMYSEENIYIEDENAEGFAKLYKDGKYAFVALLPDEDIELNEYISSLSGKRLQDMLTNAQSVCVDTAIPKFETEYKTEMSDALKNMGMSSAFTSCADFSKLGLSSSGPVYINRVLHRTYISVDENGTKAAAVTAVEMKDECCSVSERSVHLDRPFVYMLIDTKTDIPFFIGKITDI